MSMFNLPLTTITKQLMMVDQLAKFKGAMLSYGVPEYDDNDPPWGGEYAERTDNGALFTRVEKWMYETHKIKLYSTEKSDLSNMLSRSIIHPGIDIEVNNDFQWNPGDFGDKKSCFWGGKRQAWAMIYKLGGAAVKLYRGGKGIARCLILPYGEDPTKPVLFNSYGMSLMGVTSLYAWASVNGDGEVPFAWAGLSVDGHTNLPVHINDSGGYVIGVEDPKPTDISAQAYYMRRYNKYHLFCEKCYNRVSMESDNAPKSSSSYTTVTLCRECNDELRKTGNPPRYEPANAWYTIHRRIEETQPEDNAPPPDVLPGQSPIVDLARGRGWERMTSEWEQIYNTPTAYTASTTWTYQRPTRRLTHWHDMERPVLNEPNTALRYHLRNTSEDEVWSYIEERARSAGTPITSAYTPTLDEGVALALLFLRFNLDLARQAALAMTRWSANPTNTVITYWLGYVWDGSSGALGRANQAFIPNLMAEQLLAKIGFTLDEINAVPDEDLLNFTSDCMLRSIDDSRRMYRSRFGGAATPDPDDGYDDDDMYEEEEGISI